MSLNKTLSEKNSKEEKTDQQTKNHHHNSYDHHKHSHDHGPMTLKTKLIQLVLAIIIVAITPFVLNFISGDTINRAQQRAGILDESSRNKTELAVVNEIISEEFAQDQIYPEGYINQQLKATITDGPNKGKELQIQWIYFSDNKNSRIEKNQQVLVFSYQDIETGEIKYNVFERYRLPQIFNVALIFFVGVLLLAGIRGLSSFLGLIFSILVMAYYLIPSILAGNNPVSTTFITGVFICTISMFLSHGFNKRTLVAVVSTVITITITSFFASWIVDITNLTGAVSEEAFYLQNALRNSTQGIDLRGLLLSGIIVGTLGVLDDITTTQSATIAEISQANPKLNFFELLKRGMRVGQEHTISLVNTLALAYVGSSLPLLLLTIIYNTNEVWVIINGEIISAEIVRTLIGSICLLLAVPITTLMAARFLQTKNNKNLEA